MVLETKVEPPLLVEIRLVTEEQEILDVRCISSEAYASIGILKNKPKPILVYRRDYYRPNWSPTLPISMVNLPRLQMAIMTEQVAGIYWVGTTKAARGRGLAEAPRAISK